MKWIGVSSGLRGFYAVLYDRDGPIRTGIGSYATARDAAQEAVEWGQAENVPIDADARELAGQPDANLRR